MRFNKCIKCNHKYCEFCYTGDKFQPNEDNTIHHYSYDVCGHTGEVVLIGPHTDDDIRLAILNDLYSVEYEEI